ncbi:polysaccharide deacetylase family protein [Paenibacillus filicis]|uniref:Polysaccharide deacetylase family protein n=1 Tax=Paenibacillus gyeongsangnamensis TaxID=3388067 RepID=A0ABT4Q5R3_9BACL|nr:polysaccharide deacetylase family protein [Paenibacillus filicis]MCZ8512020.1 polysaccharide deacetylase family protein [Paenibacillus filicis]
MKKNTSAVIVAAAMALLSLSACSKEQQPMQSGQASAPAPAASVTAPSPAPSEQPPAAAVSAPEPPAAPPKAAKEKPKAPSESAAATVYSQGQPEANGQAAVAPKNPAGSAVTKAAPPPAQGQGDRKELSWYYMKQSKGKVPNFPPETKKFTPDMKALWVGTGKKVYLTIDTGGPLGDTKTLIKSLKDNGVKANFFIAGYNVKKDPDFVRQLVADGHLVANHTMTHTDMNLQTDEQIRGEIEDYAKLYKDVTGQEMQPYFRFPYGRYNTHILKLVSDMGYTSVFWSTAMRDWEPRKNGAEDPYNDIMNNLHDGNIILMHQGSPENIEALDRIIKAVKKAGYEFALLSDIEPPK